MIRSFEWESLIFNLSPHRLTSGLNWRDGVAQARDMLS